MNEDTIRLLNENTCSRNRITELLIGFFNDYLSYNYKVEKHQTSKERKYIICLDNCEDLIEKSYKKLQLLLKRLSDECPNLSIILTSSLGIAETNFSKPPAIQYVGNFRTAEAVHLFNELTAHAPKSLKPEDILDLILKDANYPIRKILPRYEKERIMKPIT